MKKILVLCTGNSCRSQMAEGWIRYLFPDYEVFSAGTHPEPVNKYAVSVMNDVGIDISNYFSNHVSEYKDIQFDFVITVCDNAKESCPVVFNDVTYSLHHNFEDPALAKGKYVEVISIYKNVRDQIKSYLLDIFS